MRLTYETVSDMIGISTESKWGLSWRWHSFLALLRGRLATFERFGIPQISYWYVITSTVKSMLRLDCHL